MARRLRASFESGGAPAATVASAAPAAPAATGEANKVAAKPAPPKRTAPKATEKGFSVWSWVNAPATAVEQRDPERVLEIGDGLGNDGLRNCELLGRPRHASPLHHGKQYVEVSQLEPSPYPFVQPHSYLHS